MMRRKLGILILAGVTVLAGTQEAMRQFDGLRSSVKDLTRASLWSGLIVYAQPVSDGKLPAPQIYYLMPQQTSPASPQEPVLVNNNNADPNHVAAKSETRNNHGGEELAAAVEASAEEALPQALLPLREFEDAAKSELVLNELASHRVAPHVAPAPKLERARVYEEVARHEAGARKFKQHADATARVFMKEFDAVKLGEEIAQLVAAREQLENSKLKSFADAENMERRLELRVLRRAARPVERPERHEPRIKVVAPHAYRRAITALPEISTIGCEKVKTRVKSPAAVEAIVAAAGVASSVRIAEEPSVAVESSSPGVMPSPLVTSTSWALGCDTEPEHR
ncbi:MAG TPA: hypothetical protein VGB76_14475 [Pyrinomonadaceae bacterium]|jgi:hypothetical protein